MDNDVTIDMEHVTCKTMEFNIIKPESTFVFNIEDDWLIRISEKDGIEFNDKFKSLTANDFAKEFVRILSTCYKIKFEDVSK